MTPTHSTRRRTLLGRAGSALALRWLPLSLLGLGSARAASEWQRPAFTAKTSADALRLAGTPAPTESRDILIQAPEIAENGAKVVVEVTCQIPQVRQLAVFADKNPMPLCATFDFAPTVLPYARMELKIAESTRLRAVVRTADGKAFVAYREVKVTLGGCGG